MMALFATGGANKHITRSRPRIEQKQEGDKGRWWWDWKGRGGCREMERRTCGRKKDGAAGAKANANVTNNAV